MREIPFGRPIIDQNEKDAVNEVLDSPQLVHGPRAKAFEKEFAASLGQNAHATSVSSCTAGLHLAYIHLGIGAGDEVIVPAQTHVATAHAVEITGAKPVFVDCELETGNIDIEKVKNAITENTKAICVVHYLGLPVDIRPLLDITKQKNIAIVEDCALAIGSSLDGVACGLLGDIASYSFYPIKHMTTAEGGMVVSKHKDVIDSIANIKAFGYDREPSERRIPGVYDIGRLGLNYRMNEIAAALGSEQLKKVPSFLEARKQNAKTLRTELSKIDDIRLLADSDQDKVHSNYCLVALLSDQLGDKRAQIISKMSERKIGTSVYYPVPLPLSKYYKGKYNGSADNYKNASKISNHSLALPVGPHLNTEDMKIIAKNLSEVINEVKNA